MSTFTERCELYKWQGTDVFIESNTGLSCDSFCIVYIIHLPKHRSEVGFCFPFINLSKIQQKKTFSCKLSHLLLSSYYLQESSEFGMYSRNRAVNIILYINICILS